MLDESFLETTRLGLTMEMDVIPIVVPSHLKVKWTSSPFTVNVAELPFASELFTPIFNVAAIAKYRREVSCGDMPNIIPQLVKNRTLASFIQITWRRVFSRIKIEPARLIAWFDSMQPPTGA